MFERRRQGIPRRRRSRNVNTGATHGPVRRISLRHRSIRLILHHHPLCHRFRLRSGSAEDHRLRRGRGDDGGACRQPVADVRLRHSAQRDGTQAVQGMVDAIRAEVGRTQHLCAVFESRARLAVLAMASDANGGLAHRQSANRHDRDCDFIARLADRADQYLPDQSLRAVRAASGDQQSHRSQHAGAAFPCAAVLPIRAASDLSWLHHRLLG